MNGKIKKTTKPNCHRIKMKTEIKKYDSGKSYKNQKLKKAVKTVNSKLQPTSKGKKSKLNAEKLSKQDYKSKHNIGSRCASDRIVTYCEKGRSIYDFYAKDLSVNDFSRLSNNVIVNVLKRKRAEETLLNIAHSSPKKLKTPPPSESPERKKTEIQKKPKLDKQNDKIKSNNQIKGKQETKTKNGKESKEKQTEAEYTKVSDKTNQQKTKSCKTETNQLKTTAKVKKKLKSKNDVVKKIANKTKKLARKCGVTTPRIKREASLNATAFMNIIYDYNPVKKKGDNQTPPQVSKIKKTIEEKHKAKKQNDSSTKNTPKKPKKIVKSPANSRELKNLLSFDTDEDMDCDVIKMLKTAFRSKKGLKKKIATADIQLGVWTHKRRMASLNAQAFLAVSSENDLPIKRAPAQGRRKSRNESLSEKNDKCLVLPSDISLPTQANTAAKSETSINTETDERQSTMESVGTDPIHTVPTSHFQRIEPWPPATSTDIQENMAANPGIIYWSNRPDPSTIPGRQIMNMPPKDVIRVTPRPALPNSPMVLGPSPSSYTYDQTNTVIPTSHCQTYTLSGLETLNGIPLVGFPSRSYQSAFSVPYQQQQYYQPSSTAYFQPAGPLIQTMSTDPYLHHVPVHMQPAPDVKVIFHASNSTTNIQHFGSNCCGSVTCVNYPSHQCKTESHQCKTESHQCITENHQCKTENKEDISTSPIPPMFPPSQAAGKLLTKPLKTDTSDESEIDVVGCDESSHTDEVKDDVNSTSSEKNHSKTISVVDDNRDIVCDTELKGMNSVEDAQAASNITKLSSSGSCGRVDLVSKYCSVLSMDNKSINNLVKKKINPNHREYKIFKTKGLTHNDKEKCDKLPKGISIKPSPGKCLLNNINANTSPKKTSKSKIMNKISVGRIVQQSKKQIVNIAKATVKKMTVKSSKKSQSVTKELKKSLDKTKKHLVKGKTLNRDSLSKSGSNIVGRKSIDSKVSPEAKKKVEKIKERKKSDASSTSRKSEKIKEIKKSDESSTPRKSDKIKELKTITPPKSEKNKEIKKSDESKEKIKEKKKSDESKEKPSTPPAYIHGWRWIGKPEKKNRIIWGEETPRELSCYEGIQHFDGEVIGIRDCILVKSGPRKRDIPYIAKVTQFWESDDGDMMMSLLWYYRPEHTEAGRLPQHLDRELFAAKHRDDTSVAVIEDKCYVMTLSRYSRYRARLKMQQESYRIPLVHMVPPLEDQKHKELPLKADPINVFICRKVYDFRQKRVLKNPS